MAVELKQIDNFLEDFKVKFEHDTDKEIILFMTGDEDAKQIHLIRCRDEGCIFEWQMQLLDDKKRVTIKGHKHEQLVLSHLLYLNYSTKFGSWEYDPEDGDMRLSIQIPFEDAVMTNKQFERVLDYMFRNGVEHAESIRSILKTGEVPDDKENRIAMLEGMLSKLKEEKTSQPRSI